MKMFSDSILPGAGSVPGGTESVPFRIPTGTAPTITVQPEGGDYDGVTPVTLEVTAIGDAPLTYQWYEGESGDTSTPIIGATNASYDAEPETETDYWVRVSNGVNPPADSDTATVSLTAPVITGQPVGGEYDGVTPVTLTVTATGVGLTYQWSTGPSGTKDTEIPGATSASYDAEPGEETEYYCTVTNEAGEAHSDSATVTIAPADYTANATSEYDFDPDSHLQMTEPYITSILDQIASEDLPFTDINFDTKAIRLDATQHNGRNIGHFPDASGVTGSRYRSPTTPAALGITAAAGAILLVFYPTASGATYLRLIHTTAGGFSVGMLSSSGDKLRIGARTSVGASVELDVACALNQWHVAVISWESGILTLNLDGNESTLDLTQGGADGTITNLDSGRLDIGGTYGAHYQGYADKIRFYSAAIDADHRDELVDYWTNN